MSTKPNLEEIAALVSDPLNWLVSRDRCFNLLAFSIPYAASDIPGYMITDGVTYRVGPRFAELQPQYKVGILAQAILHVAYQHIPRFKYLSNHAHLFHLANLACKLIINYHIDGTGSPRWMSLPEDEPQLETVLSMMRLPTSKDELESWDAHTLFSEMLKRAKVTYVDASEIDAVNQLIRDLNLNNVIMSWASLGNLGSNGLNRQLKNDIGITLGDYERALQAGKQEGGLIRKIEGEIKANRISLDVVRRYMMQYCSPIKWYDDSRQSNRGIALQFGYIDPRRMPSKSIGKCALVIDSSGSIYDEMIRKFIHVADQVRRQLGCQLFIISADAAVQTEVTLQSTDDVIEMFRSGKVIVGGGGGTNFVPALEHIEDKGGCNICIYLTDGYGHFGDKPKFPVIWLMTTNVVAPYGHTVAVEL